MQEWKDEEAFALIRKSGPMAALARADFDACLAFLAAELAAPAGADEPEPGERLRWTGPRIWRRNGVFGVRSRKVARLLRSNVGTITSEESVKVLVGAVAVGTLEGAYAERLQTGDRFILDGRALEFRRLEGRVVRARATTGAPSLPRWSSDRQGLSKELAAALGRFREDASRRLAEGPEALGDWLCASYGLAASASAVLVALFEAQERCGETPRAGMILIEESPRDDGWTYYFHAPLSRSACEALGRAVAARVGRAHGRDLGLTIADLGWAIHLNGDARLSEEDLPELLGLDQFDADVLEGLDRGDLLARRFRHVATTALMVLRNPEGGAPRVGGMFWVSTRLYPMVKAACPDHPLLTETRREVLNDLLDAPAARAWLETGPEIRLIRVNAPSPFATAWIEPGLVEAVAFESAADALRRLHARLIGARGAAS